MKCILCDKSLKITLNSSFLNLPVYFCGDCNIHMNGDSIQQKTEKVSDMYKKDFWDKNNAEVEINSDHTDKNSEGKKRDLISQYLYTKKFISGKNFFEIGVGTGQAILWFENNGFNVKGIEPDGRNVSMINAKLKRGKVIESSIEEFSIDEKFDVIWMSHVLEHLLQPDDFFRKIKNMLKKDGVLFIEVPNCEFKPMLKSSIEKSPHLYHFTKKSLSILASNTGYKILSCDIFRPAKKIEGIKHKILKNSFPYYPRIKTDENNGKYLRIILKNS